MLKVNALSPEFLLAPFIRLFNMYDILMQLGRHVFLNKIRFKAELECNRSKPYSLI